MVAPPLAPADLLRAAALLRLAAGLEVALEPAPGRRPRAEVRLGAQLPLGPAGVLRCDLLLADPGDGPLDLVRTLLVASVGDADRRDATLAPAAAAGVPEAWHLDPAGGWLERYRAPRAGRYRLRDLHLPGSRLTLPGGLGEVTLPDGPRW